MNTNQSSNRPGYDANDTGGEQEVPDVATTYEQLRALAAQRQARYPAGTRLRLVRFAPSDWVDDNQAVPAGTQGDVTFVDDMGTIHVQWNNGSTLGLTERDQFEVVTAASGTPSR